LTMKCPAPEHELNCMDAARIHGT